MQFIASWKIQKERRKGSFSLFITFFYAAFLIFSKLSFDAARMTHLFLAFTFSQAWFERPATTFLFESSIVAKTCGSSAIARFSGLLRSVKTLFL
jgi:hypothetical protein